MKFTILIITLNYQLIAIIFELFFLHLRATVQESTISQRLARDDSWSFDEDDVSINTSSNDESEASF